MSSLFPCSPVIRECSWKKTHIGKKMKSLKRMLVSFSWCVFKLFSSSCWWGDVKVENIMKVIHRLFFEKEPLRVEFHCWYNFYVESVKAHSSAFCFHVVDAVGLIWSFCNIIRVENASGEQCRVKFKFQTSLESNCPKGVYKMIETVWSGLTWKSGGSGS